MADQLALAHLAILQKKHLKKKGLSQGSYCTHHSLLYTVSFSTLPSHWRGTNLRISIEHRTSNVQFALHTGWQMGLSPLNMAWPFSLPYRRNLVLILFGWKERDTTTFLSMEKKLSWSIWMASWIIMFSLDDYTCYQQLEHHQKSVILRLSNGKTNFPRESNSSRMTPSNSLNMLVVFNNC